MSFKFVTLTKTVFIYWIEYQFSLRKRNSKLNIADEVLFEKKIQVFNQNMVC